MKLLSIGAMKEGEKIDLGFFTLRWNRHNGYLYVRTGFLSPLWTLGAKGGSTYAPKS